MRVSAVHIAGVGVTESTGATLADAAVSAGAKALLDAGVTYSNIDQSIACFLDEQLRIPRSCFHTFGMEGSPICEVDNHSGFHTAAQYIRSGQSNCVLIIGVDQETCSGKNHPRLLTVGVVLVSNLFLKSHAYLRDTAVDVKASTSMSRIYSRSSSGPNDSRTTKTAVQNTLRQAQLDIQDMQVIEVRHSPTAGARPALGNLQATGNGEPPKALKLFSGTTGLAGLCGLVWRLRGWSHDTFASQARNCLQYTSSQDDAVSVVILSRSDGQAAPKWEDVENVRDGRERLGYNPAVEMRGISQEDLAAVRAREEFTSDEAIKRLELPVKGGDRAALARL